MPESVIYAWIPIIAWLLTYETWAVIKSYGYTLSEAIWWCIGWVFVKSEWNYKGKPVNRKMPRQVRTSLMTGWLPVVLLLTLRAVTVRDVWDGFQWLVFVSPWETLLKWALGVLTGHFFWQRKSTYQLIDRDEWNEYADYLKRHPMSSVFETELQMARKKRYERFDKSNGYE